MRPSRPVGAVTRGTTNPNRLRRVDRWIAAVLAPALRRHRAPVVVDLGFGATPVTTLELRQRLRGPVPDVQVVGLEIDPARVAAARAAHPRADFARCGGFELGPFAGRAVLVRAFNVLRQYDEAQVAAAWRTMAGACVPGGIVIDGTCDELGRLASWIRLDGGQPTSLTVSLRLAGLTRPSAVAARLPKALIHHNVPGTGGARLPRRAGCRVVRRRDLSGPVGPPALAAHRGRGPRGRIPDPRRAWTVAARRGHRGLGRRRALNCGAQPG